MALPASSPGFALGSIAMRYERGEPGWQWPPPPTCRSAWQLPSVGREDEDELASKGPTARSPRMARVEAVLLLADEPVGSRKIAQLGNLADGTEARTLVGALNRLYDTEGCAFRVVEVAGGFQLLSRAKFAPWLQRLHSAPVEVRLSAPAIETLAVVAYRQPVLRAEVEAIRGVQCGEILRQLMERDLVRIAGRSDELGRPFLYGTTKRFLQVFGLGHLDQLPEMQWNIPTNPSETDDPIQPDPGAGEEPSDQATSSQSEQEPDVSSSTEMTAVIEEVAEEAVAVAIAQQPQVSPVDDDEDEDFEEDEEVEDEGDEEDDWDEDEEEEFEDEEEELEDDWEEVTDDEEEESEDEEEDEDDEDDDWDEDEEEDDDWDEDDEELDDWEEEDDDDWDEDEEEEDED